MNEWSPILRVITLCWLIAAFNACGGGGTSSSPSEVGQEADATPSLRDTDLSDATSTTDATLADTTSTSMDAVADLPTTTEVSYINDILPIWQAYGCTTSGCHGGDYISAELDLSTRENALNTGINAPNVIPCDSDESYLFQKILATPPDMTDSMPPTSGPRVTAEERDLIAAWIDQGAEESVCTSDDVGMEMGPGELPTLPPELVERRALNIAERTTMLSESINLPVSDALPSKLHGLGGAEVHGYTGISGVLYALDRSGTVSPLSPSWLSDASVGDLWGVATTDGGALIASTGVGLLYQNNDLLWPSPISDYIQSPVRQMLTEAATHPEGRHTMWLSSDSGLYQLIGNELFRVIATNEAPLRATAITQGPHPEDPERDALWTAHEDNLTIVSQEVDYLPLTRVTVELDGDIIDLESNRNGEIWALTSGSIYKRRVGPILGASRWLQWPLPDGEQAITMLTHHGGETWLLTDQALYYSLADGERWGLALDVPITDVIGMTRGDQGSVWLMRTNRAINAMPTPAIGLSGFRADANLTDMPDLKIFPSFEARVSSVEVRVDDCTLVTLEDSPFTITGGGLTWTRCLQDGEHQLEITANYDGGFGVGHLVVPFSWRDREEQVTWREDIEPLFMRYCSRSGCHANRAPANFDSWRTSTDDILERLELPLGAGGKMPPNGIAPTEEDRRMIRWWREDGFLY